MISAFDENGRRVPAGDLRREVERMDEAERNDNENLRCARVFLTEAILDSFTMFLERSSLPPRKLAAAIRILRHKETRSASEIAKHFRTSRAAVSKQVRALAVCLGLPSPGEHLVEPARKRARERWRHKEKAATKVQALGAANNGTSQEKDGVNLSDRAAVNLAGTK